MMTIHKGAYAGKVAFVTGASSGIGRATALAFAREGASVVVADLAEAGNQETARLIEELGGRALAVKCDVTRSEDSGGTPEGRARVIAQEPISRAQSQPSSGASTSVRHEA